MTKSRTCHGVEIPWNVANVNTVQDACKRLVYYIKLMGEDHPITDKYRGYLRDWIRHAAKDLRQ